MDRQDEAGFTLLELVISLGILAVAIGGLMSVFGAALRTTSVDVHRTDAVTVATSELTALRGAPYATLAPGPTTPVGVTVNAQSYTRSDDVEWVASSGGQGQAYKRASVVVTWTDQAGRHTLTQDTALYPGGLGPYAGPTGPLPSTTTTIANCPSPPAPSAPTLAVPATGDPSIDVRWVEPASAIPVVRWSVLVSRDGTTWTTAIADEAPLPAGAAHLVEVGGLAPGATYSVRLVASPACGSPATSPAAASSPTAGHPGSSCALASVTVDAPVAPRATTGFLTQDVTVVAATSGPCPGGLWAGVTTSGGGTSVVQLAGAGTGQYRGALAATTSPWDLGRHTVEVFAGSAVPGPLPIAPPPLSSVELCVEPLGTATC